MMSESLRLAEHSWDDVESFIDRLESLSQQDVIGDAFYAELVEGLAQTTQSLSVSIWRFDGRQPVLLACHGVEPGDIEDASVALTERWSPQATWPTGCRILSSQRVTGVTDGHARRDSDAMSLVLRASFESPPGASRKAATQDVFAAVLGITSLVCLRTKHHALQARIVEQELRDATIARLHRGGTLTESLTNIATVIADQSGIDRVSMLEVQNGRSRLAASSVARRIDRRSRHVRSMQTLVDAVIRGGAPLSYTVGSGEDVDRLLIQPLSRYVDESGCRQLTIDPVPAAEPSASPLAAIVLEQFRLSEHSDEAATRILRRYEALRGAVADATREAFTKERNAWHRIASRLTRGNFKRNMAIGGCIISVIAALLCFVSVDLQIPVEGKLIADRSASLFAPYDATVESIDVVSGQRVKAGDKLMLLRSQPLELQEKTLAGELATYQRRLAAVKASKSRPSRDAATDVSSMPGDRRVLETLIESLRERLELTRHQQSALVIKSPIDGIVQRSDLQQSLVTRPVRRGSRLVNVFEPDSGWTIALDVPDDDIGYLIEAEGSSPVKCRFRLRSDPSRVLIGHVDHIENTSHITTDGRVVVRVNVHLPEDEPRTSTDSFRVGGTVLASLQCGRRPAAFVWFRSVIEWARQQSWR